MIEYRLPDVGEGIEEAEIVRWLVQEGERVEEFEPMLEVQTDKALVELPAPATGYIKEIMASPGSRVLVGDLLLVVDDEDVPFGTRKRVRKAATTDVDPSESTVGLPDTAAGNPTHEKLTPTHSTESTGEPTSSEMASSATPAVRSFAREVGVDLHDVQGSGPNGRIEKSDVERYIERHQSLIFSRNRQTSVSDNGALLWDVVNQAKSKARRRTSDKSIQVGAEEDSVRGPLFFSAPTWSGAEQGERQPTRVPFRGVRRAAAERVVQSAFTAPHVTAFDECDVTSLVNLRKRWNERLKADGQRVSYLPFIIKALVNTLQAFPYFNAKLDEEAQEIILLPDYHIGIAVDTPDGLFVPVVRNADKLSLREVGQEIFRLSTGVRNRTLGQEYLRGSTFTITNMGSLGSVFATPILNYPEVGILGTHQIQRKPVVVGDDIVIRDVMTLSLSFDHRIIDGAMSVRFLNHLKNLLQHPEELMLELH